MTPLLARDARERFIAAYTFLCVSKNTEYDDVTLEAAITALGELPIVSVEYAAHSLAREGTHFMPSFGEWFSASDQHAADQLVAETDQKKYLPAPQLEDSEKASLRLSRDRFVQQYQELAGKTLSEAHPWKSDTLEVMTFHCQNCSDTGWRNGSCTEEEHCASCKVKRRHLYAHDFVERCVCFSTNPLLLAVRAHAHQRSRVRGGTQRKG